MLLLLLCRRCPVVVHVSLRIGFGVRRRHRGARRNRSRAEEGVYDVNPDVSRRSANARWTVRSRAGEV
jgi:hypothetical protein